jgi:hypothetical protein
VVAIKVKVATGLAIAWLLCASSIVGADSSWLETFDTFEKYPASPLPAPWEGNTHATAWDPLGALPTSADMVQAQAKETATGKRRPVLYNGDGYWLQEDCAAHTSSLCATWRDRRRQGDTV